MTVTTYGTRSNEYFIGQVCDWSSSVWMMIQTLHGRRGDFLFRAETNLIFIMWSWCTFFMVVSSLYFILYAPYTRSCLYKTLTISHYFWVKEQQNCYNTVIISMEVPYHYNNCIIKRHLYNKNVSWLCVVHATGKMFIISNYPGHPLPEFMCVTL